MSTKKKFLIHYQFVERFWDSLAVEAEDEWEAREKLKEETKHLEDVSIDNVAYTGDISDEKPFNDTNDSSIRRMR